MRLVFSSLGRLSSASRVLHRSYSTFSFGKLPLATPNWRRANRTAAWSIAALATTGAWIGWQCQTAHAEAQEYIGTVEDPVTKLSFPVQLNKDSEWRRLVGMGVRQVTFLNVNVYVLGLYMRSEDIERIRRLASWKTFDKNAFLREEHLSQALLEEPIDVTIRIVPVRTTNTQHLRDGFARSLLQRLREQSGEWTENEERKVIEAIQEFKSNFVSARVKKDTEFVFTKTREGSLKMEFDGKDMGTVNNKWLAINFVMGYLNPTSPASELARQDIATGFEKLMSV